VTLFLDIGGLAVVLADVYLYTVVHWGDASELLKRHWLSILVYVTGNPTTFLVQGVFIYRYLRLSKNTIVAIVLGLLSFLTMCAGLTTGVLSITWTAPEQRPLLRLPLEVWLSMDIATNLLISLALISEFYNNRAGLKSTDGIVQRFIKLTFLWATLPTACAIVALVGYLEAQSTTTSAIFIWFHPRAYLLSMLFMLNVRKQIGEDNQTNVPTDTIGDMEKCNDDDSK